MVRLDPPENCGVCKAVTEASGLVECGVDGCGSRFHPWCKDVHERVHSINPPAAGGGLDRLATLVAQSVHRNMSERMVDTMKAKERPHTRAMARTRRFIGCAGWA